MIKLPDFSKAFDYENNFYLSSSISRLGKIIAHYELYKMIKNLQGDIVECGVFKGPSFIRFASFRNLFDSPNSKKVIGFDAFGKFPETEFEEDKEMRKKFIKDSGEEGIDKEQLIEVLKHKGIDKNVELIKGNVCETVPEYVRKNPELKISLLNLDTDVYEPAVVVLKYLWPKIVKGGILIIDDYGVFPGETKAVDEFFKGTDIKINKFHFSKTPCYIIKKVNDTFLNNKNNMIKMAKQSEKWTEGDFGKKYTDRNPQSNEEMDQLYIDNFGVSRTSLNNEFLSALPKDIKILEGGCNVGGQLKVLQKMGFKNLTGFEVQRYAVEEGKKQLKDIDIIQGSLLDIPFKDGFFDLVFTSGVLIHINPADLPNVIDEIYRVSNKYIWCYEYYSDECEEINYRGNVGYAWKNNFLKLFLERYPNLKLIKEKKINYLNDNNVDIMFLLEKSSD